MKAASEADQGLKIALAAVGVDSNKDAFGKGNDETLDGFNAGAQGDIEVYEARNGEEIATRINSGGNVSAADYAELDRSFRDNTVNKAFSQTFLSGLGPGGTITLTDTLIDGALHSDKKNGDRYQNLQKGLANTVAGATEVPGKVSDAPPGSKSSRSRWTVPTASSTGSSPTAWARRASRPPATRPIRSTATSRSSA
ncbi:MULTISPECIES: hypothetical protein [unclassified Streptomyces]|uniref:hypothetical protein n=1 Tax=unclassified Streptomyces TaxID=2593676 RepID=UPI0035D74886